MMDVQPQHVYLFGRRVLCSGTEPALLRGAYNRTAKRICQPPVGVRGDQHHDRYVARVYAKVVTKEDR